MTKWSEMLMPALQKKFGNDYDFIGSVPNEYHEIIVNVYKEGRYLETFMFVDADYDSADDMCMWLYDRLFDNISNKILGKNGIEKLADSIGKQYDIVNKPEHYASTSIECIDAMIETQGKEVVIDFCICNAFKYLWRRNKKNGIEDLRKCKWYIDKCVELLEQEDN
mgnify:CR=1 FL=1